MKEQLDLLYDLQQLDTKMDYASKQLRGLDDGTNKRVELKGAEAEVAEMEEALTRRNSEQLNRELELESTETERSEKWGRAYGGTVSDSKELSSLERKIDELQRRKEKLEEELIEMYDDVEERTKEADAQRKRVAELNDELRTIVSTFEQRSAELNGVIDQAQIARAAITEKLDANLLDDYETIRERSGGIAVAVTQERMCSGCRVSMSLMIYERVQEGKEVVRCEGCRRILHPGK